MKSWYTIRARNEGAEVLIYDEIGAHGVSAKGFLAELGALPDDMAIDLRLNSPGGSVFDAVAIYNALSRHAGTITVWIDGIAASAASYIAMAGDEIVMPENAFLMNHDPSGIVMGTAADMRDMAGTLDKIAASMLRGYAARSGKPEEEIAALLAAETWFDAAEALEAGLATRLAEPVRIAASFDIGQFRNAPPALVEAVEAAEPEGADDADIVGDDNDVAPGADAGPQAENAPGVADGKTIELIQENVHVDTVRDDLDTLVMDAELLEAVLGNPDPEKKAKEISVKLTSRLRKHAGNPKYKALAERLEDLKNRHQRGLLLSIDFLKELLALARDVVKMERETTVEEDIDRGKAALTELFEEAKNGETPIMVKRVVDDIDEIVRAVRFDGWQATHAGEREVKKALRQTLFKYKLHQDAELFERAYGYIREYY